MTHPLRASGRILLAALTLSACSFGQTPYNAGTFTLQLPKGWTAVTPGATDAPDTKLALLKKDANGENIVLTIQSRTLPAASASDFVRTALVQAASLPGYEELRREEIEIAGAKTTLLHYKALLPGTAAPQRFAHAPAVTGTTGIIFAARLPNDVSEDAMAEISGIISSYTAIENVPSSIPPSSGG